jgi:hypothetical protein
VELRCQAPSREQPGTLCGWKVGEDDRELVLLVVAKVEGHYDRLFPAPRVVKRCARCRWWSVYEPKGLRG